MAITLPEKNHWKSRIEQKIDERIETIRRGDPELFQSIKNRARSVALNNLGIEAKFTRLTELEATQSRISQEIHELERAIYAKAVGTGLYTYRAEEEVNKALDAHAGDVEAELLGQHEPGREILRLRAEKNNFLDTLWLATSPQHVRTMWEGLVRLLGEEATAIQKDILSTEQS